MKKSQYIITVFHRDSDPEAEDKFIGDVRVASHAQVVKLIEELGFPSDWRYGLAEITIKPLGGE